MWREFIWFIVGIILCILIGFVVSPVGPILTIQDWLLTGSYVAQIVTAFAVGIAAASYLQQKRNNSLMSVADQVRMFRTEVLPLYSRIHADVIAKVSKVKKITYPTCANIDIFSVEWLLKNRTRVTLVQHIFWNSARKNPNFFGLEDNWEKMFSDLLNLLEELSIKIDASGTVNDPNLLSIHKVYISCVEHFIWQILLTSPYDNKYTYPGIKKIYGIWVKEFDRTPDENVSEKLSVDISAAATLLRESMSVAEYEELMKPEEFQVS